MFVLILLVGGGGGQALRWWWGMVVVESGEGSLEEEVGHTVSVIIYYDPLKHIFNL
jgi:hypothetical protein